MSGGRDSGTSEGHIETPGERPRYVPILRRAAGFYRRHTLRVLALTSMIFVPVAIIDGVLTHLIEETLPAAVSPDWLDIIVFGVELVDLSAGVTALTFFAGAMELLVEADAEGGRPPSLGDMVRRLPWRALLLADVLVWGITSVAAVAFIAPGIFAFTLLAIVGPIVVIERIGPVAAVVRSARLVLHHLPMTFLLLVVPTFGQEALSDLIFEAEWRERLSFLLLADLAVVLVLTSAIGVVESYLARAVLAFHGPACPHSAPASAHAGGPPSTPSQEGDPELAPQE